MDNVRSVWEAEHSVEENKKKQVEHLKRLKEERQIEELKRIQIEQGLIPASSLNMIDWMYQDRSAFNKGQPSGSGQGETQQTAEEYLLGKPVQDGDLQRKQ